MNAATYTEIVTDVLRRNYGTLRHASERLARSIGTKPRTVQNWLNGTNAPQGAQLIRLMSTCDELRTTIFQLVEDGKCPNVSQSSQDGAVSGTNRSRSASTDAASSPS